MKNNIRKFRPSTNWITTVLLTLFVTTFGIFAQTHASECVDSFGSELQVLHIGNCDNQISNIKQQTPTLYY